MPQLKKAPNDWFEKRIAELLETAKRLRSMQDSNDFEVVTYTMPRKKVEAYWRGAHVRRVYRKRREK